MGAQPIVILNNTVDAQPLELNRHKSSENVAKEYKIFKSKAHKLIKPSQSKQSCTIKSNDQSSVIEMPNATSAFDFDADPSNVSNEVSEVPLRSDAQNLVPGEKQELKQEMLNPLEDKLFASANEIVQNILMFLNRKNYLMHFIHSIRKVERSF